MPRLQVKPLHPTASPTLGRTRPHTDPDPGPLVWALATSPGLTQTTYCYWSQESWLQVMATLFEGSPRTIPNSRPKRCPTHHSNMVWDSGGSVSGTPASVALCDPVIITGPMLGKESVEHSSHYLKTAMSGHKTSLPRETNYPDLKYPNLRFRGSSNNRVVKRRGLKGSRFGGFRICVSLVKLTRRGNTPGPTPFFPGFILVQYMFM